MSCTSTKAFSKLHEEKEIWKKDVHVEERNKEIKRVFCCCFYYFIDIVHGRVRNFEFWPVRYFWTSVLCFSVFFKMCESIKAAWISLVSLPERKCLEINVRQTNEIVKEFKTRSCAAKCRYLIIIIKVVTELSGRWTMRCWRSHVPQVYFLLRALYVTHSLLKNLCQININPSIFVPIPIFSFINAFVL